MVAVECEELYGPAIITAISCFQMTTFAQRVGKARRKFKISPPATSGDPGFVRVFRAQQNCVEFYPVFLAGLWSSSLLCHQVPSSLVGIVYIVARERYFTAYSQAVELRMPPFKTCMWCLVGLTLLNCFGLGNIICKKITGRSILGLY